MLNAFTAAVSPSVKRALALRPTLFTSLNTNMRSILFYAHSYSILCRFNLLVGLSGLEPPTSRLSGVRSNRLSYKPIFPAFRLFPQAFGGDKRDRTADPLLAKQVLSQLSYTPVYLGQDPEN